MVHRQVACQMEPVLLVRRSYNEGGSEVEGLMHVSGEWIQHAVGVLLVKIFCRARSKKRMDYCSKKISINCSNIAATKT